MILQPARGLIVSFIWVFSSIIRVLIENILNCWQLHWYLVVTDPERNPNIKNTTTKLSPGSDSAKQLEERREDTVEINGNYDESEEASKEATNAVAMVT